MSRVAGADVAKGRWVVAALEAGRFVEAVIVDHLNQLRQRLGPLAHLALDIPIGLPSDGSAWPRPADTEARAIIGPRRSSVFLTPPRPVLDAASYGAANLLHRELTGRGLSRQTWGLRERILEAERYTFEHPDVVEVHPEVCFRMMKGSPLTHSKKTWNGQMERRALLHAQGIELPDLLPGAGAVPPDDLLDATAAAWTAWRVSRGEARTLPPSNAEDDTSGRPAIWF
jgi:predicted RNase H-like nuclease